MNFWGSAILLKTYPTQILPREIWQISKNNNSEEHLRVTAFKVYKKEIPTQVLSCEFCKLFISNYFAEDLRLAGSETPLCVSFFNKVACLTAWRPIIVSERDSLSDRYFSVSFVKHLLANISHMMLLFFFLFADQWGLKPKISLFGGPMVD